MDFLEIDMTIESVKSPEENDTIIDIGDMELVLIGGGIGDVVPA